MAHPSGSRASFCPSHFLGISNDDQGDCRESWVFRMAPARSGRHASTQARTVHFMLGNFVHHSTCLELRLCAVIQPVNDPSVSWSYDSCVRQGSSCDKELLGSFIPWLLILCRHSEGWPCLPGPVSDTSVPTM